jgi:hypothetical protein
MGFPIKRKKREAHIQKEEVYEEPPIAQPPFPLEKEREKVEPQICSGYLSSMIVNKKERLGVEKQSIDRLRRDMEEHIKEIEALQFIKSGDPTIAISDMLEIIEDYRRNDAEKTALEILDDMERSLIKSTMESL